MKDFSRRNAIKLGAGALAAASLPNFGRAQPVYGTNNIGLPLIPFTIKNNTGRDVYMYAFGVLNPPTGTESFFVSDINGDCKKFPFNAGPASYSVKLPGNVTNASWPQLQGGRIYFSIGQKLTTTGTGPTGLPDAIVPNVSTRPEFNVLWDFLEMNWIPEKTHSILQGNLSQVNAFALAFELVMNGGTPSDPTVPSQLIFGFGPGGLRAKILAEIAAAGAPWSNLIIPNPTPGGVPLRALQPGYALTGVGVPAFPKDQLFDYIHNVILPHYDMSTTNRLVYAGLLPQQWKGFTSGGKFIFKPDNAKTTTTYTFNAPTTVEVYNNGILGNPDDGNSGAIAAALGASICRSTLGYDPGFPVPQPERNLYYTKPPIFEYAAIIHKYALDNHAFCFGYDEIAQDNGPTNQVWNPTSLAITIRGLT